MESPIIVDKPPEYHGSENDRGFPFESAEGSGAWSELASRHPDIAARLRNHPAASANWARKRRPTSQDAEDFGDRFGGFDRFPFDEIPPEFRGHFPSHWNRRFSAREPQVPPQAQSSNQQQPQPPPQQQTTATQTTATQTEPSPPPETPQQTLPQYGLRNTVDLGQKSALDPSLVNEDDRNQRSMSAPPDSNQTNMSGQNHQEPPHGEQPHPQPQSHSKVRNIPIFVEGRDQPVINENVDHAPHFGESKPKPQQYAPQQPPLDSSYFTEEGPINFNHPPNFTRAFGTPFGKTYNRQGQPYAQQKAYPQNASNFRGASPQRSQSPKPPQHEEFVKVPVHHEPPRPQPRPQQQHQAPPQQQQQHPPPPPQQQPQQQPQQKQATPPPQPKPATTPNDPITQIVAIQTDVLNLMTEVENFTGTKKDKRYLFLDEMLTRNLIKLDNIETDGKENIRNARKEAIRCIQKCIAVLEAKAEKNTPQPQEGAASPLDVEMNSQPEPAENGEVDMKEPAAEAAADQPAQPAEPTPAETKEATPAPDTRPEQNEEKAPEPETKPKETKEENVDKKTKKGKNVKKRDKSKEATKTEAKDEKKNEAMQVDDKGDKPQQAMDVDGAASQ